MTVDDCGLCKMYFDFFRTHTWPKCRVAEITGERVPTPDDKEYSDYCNMALDWNIHLQEKHCGT